MNAGRHAESEVKQLVELADRDQIASALSALNVEPGGSWLDRANIYAENASTRIRDDDKKVSEPEQFVQYLAASAFVHCGDAWGYFGRALDALVRGDAHAAVHLIYYAELRGSFSLLASEGIYIGEGVQCVVNKEGNFAVGTKDPTHRAVWNYLTAWAGTSKCEKLLGRALRPGGTEFSNWRENLHHQSLVPVLSDLLERVLGDLEKFTRDRKQRNLASYNPTRLRVPQLPTERLCELVHDTWTRLEPDRPGGFPEIDRLLVQQISSAQYRATNTTADDPEAEDPEPWPQWRERIAPTQVRGTRFLDDLRSRETTESAPTESLIDYIEAMLWRMSVLLRLATGSCLLLREESELSNDAVHRWVEALSLARGLWKSGEPPDSALDLWADVEAALEVLGERRESIHGIHDLLHSLGGQLTQICQAERVVAWSFARCSSRTAPCG